MKISKNKKTNMLRNIVRRFKNIRVKENNLKNRTKDQFY